MHSDVAPAVRPAYVLVGAQGDDEVRVLTRGTAGTNPAVGKIVGGYEQHDERVWS